jgi:hypothetical protein
MPIFMKSASLELLKTSVPGIAVPQCFQTHIHVRHTISNRCTHIPYVGCNRTALYHKTGYTSQPQQAKQVSMTASVNLAVLERLVGLRDKTQNPLCSVSPIRNIVSNLCEFLVFRIGGNEILVFLGHDHESLAISFLTFRDNVLVLSSGVDVSKKLSENMWIRKFFFFFFFFFRAR